MNLNQLYCIGFFFQAKNSAIHVNMYVHNKKPEKCHLIISKCKCFVF